MATPLKTATLLLVFAALAGGGGYWAGHQGLVLPGQTGTAPMPGAHKGQSDSGAPAAGNDSTSTSTSADDANRILYYRNPMGLPDTSPEPKKDSMGMDYIPVYAHELEATAGQIRISTEKVQKLGVRTQLAQLRVLDRTVRAAGRIEPDERRVYAVAPRFEGYVEHLHVNVTGQPVEKGQALFEVYSPELVSAQREYLIASQGLELLKDAAPQAQEGMRQLASASLMRLKNWDISAEQIQALAQSGESRHTLTVRAPASGIVTAKNTLEGMRFMPGEMLYQITDLSRVWVVADVFEQDIGLLATGAKARVHINAYPDKVFEGTVTYVYPTLNAQTRTIPVRVELPNPDLLLKPAMFAQVELAVGMAGKVITVPTSAVIDSGTRRILLVEVQEGRFEPREVKLGQRSDYDIEVLEGVKEGESVVVAANFLIDAESNLMAAIGSFGGADSTAADVSNKVGHQADGVLEAVDADNASVSVTHDPIPSLKWPAMTMDFMLANPGLVTGIDAGTAIRFEFVERGPGEWVITTLTPAQPHTDP